MQVADFGLSRVLQDDKNHIKTQTFGTVTHVPPELLSKGTLTTKADVYAIGVLMWELYTAEKVSQRGWLHEHSREGEQGGGAGNMMDYRVTLFLQSLKILGIFYECIAECEGYRLKLLFVTLTLLSFKISDTDVITCMKHRAPNAPKVFKQLSDSEVILAVVTKKARPTFPTDVPSRYLL
jgi:hypothetical protein